MNNPKQRIYNQYIVTELENPDGTFAGYKCESRVENTRRYGRVYKYK